MHDNNYCYLILHKKAKLKGKIALKFRVRSATAAQKKIKCVHQHSPK